MALAASVTAMVVAGSGHGASDSAEMIGAPAARIPTHVGKLDLRLFATLQTLGSRDKIRVGIWLIGLDPPPEVADRADISGLPEEASAFQERKTRALAALYRRHSRRLLQQIAAGGGRVNRASRLAPLVFAEVPAGLVHTLEQLAEVDTIYLEEVTGGPEVDTQVRVHQATLPWDIDIVGLRARACVVEGGGVASENPWIKFAEYWTPTGPSSTQHTTAVAGLIQSTANPDFRFSRDMRATAWGARGVLSGNSPDFSESNLIAATEWCVLDNTPRAAAVNHSYFLNTSRNQVAMDRYLDHVVRAHAVLQVKSAGNRGQSDGHVTSPGKGWNTLTVGSIDDKDTVGAADDTMSPFSSWVDPLVPGSLTRVISKPEIVAVGCHKWNPGMPSISMRSTIAAEPWTGNVGCGTSFSAPAVVGTALLIYQTRPVLRNWPEATKAILMATATENIEGNSSFSAKDGAGRLRTDLAVNLAGSVTDVVFKTIHLSTYGTRDEIVIARSAGQRLRCVLVWNSASGSHPNDGPPSTNALLTDLDLRIVRASTGGVIASSTSADNAFEIVDLYVPAADKYKVRVTVSATSERSNHIGVACH